VEISEVEESNWVVRLIIVFVTIILQIFQVRVTIHICYNKLSVIINIFSVFYQLNASIKYI
jgi:hypothetical protein